MKLRELKNLLYGMLLIYEARNAEEIEYDDLFLGEYKNMPEELQEKEIHVIGAATRNDIAVIEIQVKKGN